MGNDWSMDSSSLSNNGLRISELDRGYRDDSTVYILNATEVNTLNFMFHFNKYKYPQKNVIQE